VSVEGGHSTWLRRVRPWLYLVTSASATLVAAVFLEPWNGTDLSIFPRGVDELWQQAMFQVFGLAGPVGTTDHLAYPIGMSGWALPQMGLFAGLFAWLTVGVGDVPAAASVLWFQAVCAGLNAMAMLFAARSFPAGRRGLLPVAIAVTMGASWWTAFHQLNLAFFAVLPVVLGVAVRAEVKGDRRIPIAAMGVVFLCTAISPMWWAVVLVMVLAAAAVAPLLRRNWLVLRMILQVWAAVLLSFIVQAALAAWHHGPGSDASREAWQSNWGGGHFVDLILGSPLVQEILPRDQLLIPGASVEAAWGIAPVLLSVIALLVLVRIPPVSVHARSTLFLASATVVSALFWLAGGLGNLQAAMAVLLGTVSPARAWYRVMLVLAIAGGMWLFAVLSRPSGPPKAERRLLAVVGAILLVAGALDLIIAHRNYPAPIPATKYAAMVDSVRGKVPAGCAVAQLPNETVPNQRASQPGIVWDDLTYRSYLPFALAPEFRWSGGSYVAGQTASDNPVTGVAQEATVQDFDRLRDAGYCAVLFDKGVSQAALDNQAAIEGRTIEESVGQPVWQDDIYALYLLN